MRQTNDTAACRIKLSLELFDRSHFREALDSDQQLQWVILAQREWGPTLRRAGLDAGWSVIASQVQTLYGPFCRMAAALELLQGNDGRPTKPPVNTAAQ